MLNEKQLWFYILHAGNMSYIVAARRQRGHGGEPDFCPLFRSWKEMEYIVGGELQEFLLHCANWVNRR